MIRTALFDDLDALVSLARCYHDEAHGWLPFDADYVRESFRMRCIDTMDGICLLLVEGIQPVGFLAAAVSSFFSAPIKIAAELAWYVHPDHRGRGAALLDEFEAWARERGCAACGLGMNEFPDPRRSEALARLYRRNGYDPFERAFLKKL